MREGPMLTLSLVFEDRDRDGMLTDYKRIDLDTISALEWCGSMVRNDNIDDGLRIALLGFISVHAPEVLSKPAKVYPTWGGDRCARDRCKNGTRGGETKT
jgi:hypothetical protein